MGLLDNFIRSGILSRKEEGELWDLVADELENGNISRGMWLKALSEASGDEQRAKAIYCKYRVQSLKDDKELLRQVLKAHSSNTSSAPSNTPPSISEEEMRQRQNNQNGGCAQIVSLFISILAVLTFIGAIMMAILTIGYSS